jgi:hypothetical protein
MPIEFMASNMPIPSRPESPEGTRIGSRSGMIRTHQPRSLDAVPALRNAIVSAGVIVS